MSCEYCKYVTPGFKCNECGTLKPKQIPSRDSWLLLVIVFLLVFLIWRIEVVLQECSHSPFIEGERSESSEYQSANWREL